LCCLASAACSAPAERSAPGPLCDAEDDLEFEAIDFLYWFAFGDDTPRAYRPQPNTEDPDAPNGPPNPDGENPSPGPCGLQSTLFFRSVGHNDWGSGFGSNVTSRTGAHDGSAFEGLSFWGRTDPGNDRGFTIIINNEQNSWPSDVDATSAKTVEATRLPTDCTLPSADGTVIRMQTQDEGSTLITSTGVPDRTDCGNEFSVDLFTSYEWQLYLIPWTDFHQNAFPNREPKGLNPTAIYQFAGRAVREVSTALRTTDWQFYRHTGFEPPEYPMEGAGE